MHYSQAGVYAMIGYERLLEVLYGTDSYGLDSSWIDETTATQPDIFSQFG